MTKLIEKTGKPATVLKKSTPMLMLCTDFYNLKNVKITTHGGMLLLAKLQTPALLKVTFMGVFTFFKLHKWYQIARIVSHHVIIMSSSPIQCQN